MGILRQRNKKKSALSLRFGDYVVNIPSAMEQQIANCIGSHVSASQEYPTLQAWFEEMFRNQLMFHYGKMTLEFCGHGKKRSKLARIH